MIFRMRVVGMLRLIKRSLRALAVKVKTGIVSQGIMLTTQP